MTSTRCRSPPISSSTGAKTCGFTASITTSAQATASRLSDPTRTAYWLFNRSHRACTGSVAHRNSGEQTFPESRPPMIASAIWPPPTKAIFFVNALATPPSENRGSQTNQGGPLLDGHHIIVRHAHRKLRQLYSRDSPLRQSRRQFPETAKMRPRLLCITDRRRNGHQPLNRHMVQRGQPWERLLDLVRQEPGFALFHPEIDFQQYLLTKSCGSSPLIDL